MDDFFTIAVIVALVVLGPWMLVWWSNSRRKRERAEEREQWRELTSRTYTLEQAVLKLQAQLSSRAAEGVSAKESGSPAAASQVSPAPITPTPDIVSSQPAPPAVKYEPSAAERMAERSFTCHSECATWGLQIHRTHWRV
jgi:hypothetical protein